MNAVLVIEVYARESPEFLSVPPSSGGEYLCQCLHLGPPTSKPAGNEHLSFTVTRFVTAAE